jgi:glycine/serine hydroxymethyltransferase
MPAMTTRWIKETDTKQIVQFMDEAFKCHSEWNEESRNLKLQEIRSQVKEFCKNFPVPGI